VHLGDVGRRRDLAGADRPDRLIGDDELALALAGLRSEPRSCPETTSIWAPAARCSSLSPTQTIACRPWRSAASALARTDSFDSRCSARRSLWPTMTRRAPTSFSMAAETEPVQAPLSLPWQSCAPIGMPPARARAGAISVKGGQMATSTPAWPLAAAAIWLISLSAPSDPFIFQLPTTSLRRTLCSSTTLDFRAA
jgi:hypothetical protein